MSKWAFQSWTLSLNPSVSPQKMWCQTLGTPGFWTRVNVTSTPSRHNATKGLRTLQCKFGSLTIFKDEICARHLKFVLREIKKWCSRLQGLRAFNFFFFSCWRSIGDGWPAPFLGLGVVGKKHGCSKKQQHLSFWTNRSMKLEEMLKCWNALFSSDCRRNFSVALSAIWILAGKRNQEGKEENLNSLAITPDSDEARFQAGFSVTLPWARFETALCGPLEACNIRSGLYQPWDSFAAGKK